MKRTSRRPLVVNGHGTICRGRPWSAASPLGACATLLLGLMANWLSAALADAAILFYIFVYTLLPEARRSPANIVIGGAAGCFPVLVGWAAVTGTVSLPAVVLFAVIFLLDAAALLGAGDEVPRRTTRRRTCRCCRWWRRPPAVARKILWYSYAMVAATLALVPYAGWIYGVLAAALGAWFVAEAHQLNTRRRRRRRWRWHAGQAGSPSHSPRRCACSTCRIAYLTLLFAAVAVTALLPGDRW